MSMYTNSRYPEFYIDHLRQKIVHDPVLKNLSFRGLDLSGTNFSSTWIDNVDFSNAILTDCNFQNSVFIEVILKDSILTNSIFNSVHFLNTDVSTANLEDIKQSFFKDYLETMSQDQQLELRKNLSLGLFSGYTFVTNGDLNIPFEYTPSNNWLLGIEPIDFLLERIPNETRQHYDTIPSLIDFPLSYITVQWINEFSTRKMWKGNW